MTLGIRFILPRSIRGGLPAVLISCALTLAAAETAQFGFNSVDGNGNGVEITDDPTFHKLSRLNKAIDTLATLDLTIKGGVSYDGAQIAADLRRMLKEGRLGEGKGAKGSANGATSSDSAAGCVGDRINIADQHLETANTRNLARTLAHEWLHTQQLTSPGPGNEAPAYQVGLAVLEALGGTHDTGYYGDNTKMKEAKALISGGGGTKLPGSNTPSGASRQSGGKGGKNHTLVVRNPDSLSYSLDAEALHTVAPAPLHAWFSVNAVKMPGDDRVLVFGADTTAAATPNGWLTVLNANGTQYYARQELPLLNTRHPSYADYDPATRKWYILDTHNNGSGITIWQDTNGDSIPDTRQAAPFASHFFPGVATATSLVLAVHPGLGSGVIVTPDDLGAQDGFTFGRRVTFLKDVNADGVADQSVSVAGSDFISFAPAFADSLHLGTSALRVTAMANHLIQVWKTDAAGTARTELLAQGQMPAAGLLPLTLTRMLVGGEDVIPVDLSAGTQPAAPTHVAVALPGWSPIAAVTAAAMLALLGLQALGVMPRATGGRSRRRTV